MRQLSEILVERSLGFHLKPLVIINPDGFWDPLLAQFDKMLCVGLIKPSDLRVLHSVEDAARAIAIVEESAPRPASGSGARSEEPR